MQIVIGVHVHRSELQHRERLPGRADADLPEEDGPRDVSFTRTAMSASSGNSATSSAKLPTTSSPRLAASRIAGCPCDSRSSSNNGSAGEPPPRASATLGTCTLIDNPDVRCADRASSSLYFVLDLTLPRNRWAQPDRATAAQGLGPSRTNRLRPCRASVAPGFVQISSQPVTLGADSTRTNTND